MKQRNINRIKKYWFRLKTSKTSTKWQRIVSCYSSAVDVTKEGFSYYYRDGYLRVALPDEVQLELRWQYEGDREEICVFSCISDKLFQINRSVVK